ncbi:MAG TPA: hypothetical protein VGJ91_12080 [Polyangiaceae bacterium]
MIWLVSLGLFLAGLGRGPGLALEQLLFRGEFSALFVGHLIVVLLAVKALSAHRLAGQTPWRFYRDKPPWSGVVQMALLLLTLLLIITSPDGRVQRDLSGGGVAHCVHSVNGEFAPLDAAGCDALRLSGLRTAMAVWASLSWIAVTQFALAGTRRM